MARAVIVGEMEGRYECESREPRDPWRGRQPKYEKLVMHGPRHFAAVARLPSGERVEVRLGRGATLQQRREPPR